MRERLRQRDPTAVDPLFVGLLNPNSQGGVIMNSAPLAGYADVVADVLLDYLAANVYAGSGAHGVFMKTWGAGLAYSNGIRARPANGRLSYYAERTPELPQTLRFVVDELRRAGKPDPALVEYAIAEASSETRAAAPFEAGARHGGRPRRRRHARRGRALSPQRARPAPDAGSARRIAAADAARLRDGAARRATKSSQCLTASTS
ncbi:MAG: hypothetical protein IPI73_05650 [Betaproteobacteria bacterium]|nr:hypothetical protein [Betaproteobacteria bacterium]